MPNAYYRLTLDDGTLDYIGSACDHPDTLRSMFPSWCNRTGRHKVVGFDKCSADEAHNAWGLVERMVDPGVIEGLREAGIP